MHQHLPTLVSGKWSVTSLRDSLHAELRCNTDSKKLRMFFYAITRSGWREIRKEVIHWHRAGLRRSVVVFVGTDHAITDPSALEMMKKDHIDVRLMEEYQGVFHPKVVWLEGEKENIVWVGSNNLTRDGLLKNIEFAVVVRSKKIPPPLKEWAEAVESGSVVLTDEQFKSYKDERKKFEEARAEAKATTFTWSKKREPKDKVSTGTLAGSLILEVMPKETGADGSQVQIPRQAAKVFFGLQDVGARTIIILKPKGGGESRKLTMTMFKNFTARLSINELEFRDRPCVIVFRKLKARNFEFEIIPQSIYPTRYKALLACCSKRTRESSRRWAIVPLRKS